jgi:hypothetical protein
MQLEANNYAKQLSSGKMGLNSINPTVETGRKELSAFNESARAKIQEFSFEQTSNLPKTVADNNMKMASSLAEDRAKSRIRN